MKVPLAIRFWRHVNKSGPTKRSELGPCWLWTGGTNGVYGTASRDDRSTVGAHIAAWFITTGKWPTKYVLHKCDNPLCVRFSHLFTGTQQDNITDMLHKERAAVGEMHPGHKLTSIMIRGILRALRHGTPQTVIAKAYGVCQPLICGINRKKKWRHLQ